MDPRPAAEIAADLAVFRRELRVHLHRRIESVPIRLHAKAHADGALGGPAFSPAFERYLVPKRRDYPLMAAIGGLRARRPPVPRGCPEVADVLDLLVACKGNPETAVARLRLRWPAMADRASALLMIDRALRLFAERVRARAA